MKEHQKRNQESELQPRISKFIIVQENGKVRYLEGDVAQKYIDQIDSVLGFMQTTRRYMLPEDFLNAEWKEIDIKDAGKLFQEKSEDTKK